MGEPSRRMNEHKEQAKELFAKAFALDPAFTPDWGRGRRPRLRRPGRSGERACYCSRRWTNDILLMSE
jgi:hypothetical protein